jgi:hypothetical protein
MPADLGEVLRANRRSIRQRAREYEDEEEEKQPPPGRRNRFQAGLANDDEEEDVRPRARRFESGPCDDPDIAPRVPLPGELEAKFREYLAEKRRPMDVEAEDVDAPPGGAPIINDNPDAIYDALVARMERMVLDADRACDIRARDDLSADLLRDIRRSAGDLRLEQINKTLNNMGYTRSTHQRMFHDNFIKACLPIIFGDDWSLASDRVMAEMKIDRIRPEVLVQAPRRFGKTVSVAMYVCALSLQAETLHNCLHSRYAPPRLTPRPFLCSVVVPMCTRCCSTALASASACSQRESARRRA